MLRTFNLPIKASELLKNIYHISWIPDGEVIYSLLSTLHFVCAFEVCQNKECRMKKKITLASGIELITDGFIILPNQWVLTKKFISFQTLADIVYNIHITYNWVIRYFYANWSVLCIIILLPYIQTETKLYTPY